MPKKRNAETLDLDPLDFKVGGINNRQLQLVGITSAGYLDAEEDLLQGHLLARGPGGGWVLASAVTVDGRWSVRAVSGDDYLTGETARGFLQEAIIPVRFGVAPAAVDNQARVWLGVGGLATLTPPAGGGVTWFEVGELHGADGVSTTPDVLVRLALVAHVA